MWFSFLSVPKVRSNPPPFPITSSASPAGIPGPQGLGLWRLSLRDIRSPPRLLACACLRLVFMPSWALTYPLSIFQSLPFHRTLSGESESASPSYACKNTFRSTIPSVPLRVSWSLSWLWIFEWVSVKLCMGCVFTAICLACYGEVLKKYIPRSYFHGGFLQIE